MGNFLPPSSSSFVRTVLFRTLSSQKSQQNKQSIQSSFPSLSISSFSTLPFHVNFLSSSPTPSILTLHFPFFPKCPPASSLIPLLLLPPPQTTPSLLLSPPPPPPPPPPLHLLLSPTCGAISGFPSSSPSPEISPPPPPTNLTPLFSSLPKNPTLLSLSHAALDPTLNLTTDPSSASFLILATVHPDALTPPPIFPISPPLMLSSLNLLVLVLSLLSTTNLKISSLRSDHCIIYRT